MLSCQPIYAGRAEGPALVCREPFPLSGVTFDLPTGTIRWPGHALDGRSVKDQVLVLPRINAFAGGDWALLALSQLYRSGPRAILCDELPTFLAAGALLGKIVTLSKLHAKFLGTIKEGDLVSVDVGESTISVRQGAAGSQVVHALELVGQDTDFKLTDAEKRIADGQSGPALKECLDVLVGFGKAVGATSLIPIKSVHAAGSGYNTTGEAATKFLSSLADKKLRTAVPATLNPIALDLQRWDAVQRLPSQLHKNQLELNQAFETLGFIATYSCKPYWTSHAPKAGDNFVSSEHNVVSYSNSVIGARTNFESNIVAVVAALVGRIPNYGLYLEQNRLPQVMIHVHAELKEAVDWRCLGVVAAKRASARIPYFQGLKEIPTQEDMRELCASFGPPWTSAPMLHVQGATPAWEAAGRVASTKEAISVTQRDLDQVRDELFVSTDAVIDLVALGCPQASTNQIRAIAERVEGRRIAPGTRLWIWTDAQTWAESASLGYVAAIQEAGGDIISDTCGCAACPIDRSGHSFRHIATDSTKSVGFLQRSGMSTHLGSLDECIHAALTGKWRRSGLRV